MVRAGGTAAPRYLSSSCVRLGPLVYRYAAEACAVTSRMQRRGTMMWNRPAAPCECED